MKTLFLIRHAEAQDLFGLPDSFRGLTKRGNAQANEIGTLYPPLPLYWIVSPAVRTYATAHILAAHQKQVPQIHLLPDLYMSNCNTYLDCLFTLPNEVDSAVLVGHNPSISELHYVLTKESLVFKKGCLAEIQFNSTDWVSLAQCMGNRISLKVPTV
ncbi:MAG: SixA phosphatase family protein [Bacteroidota bacterium]